jgi:hypothetical protein
MENWSMLITVVPDPVVEAEMQVGAPNSKGEETSFLERVQDLASDYAKWSWRYSVLGLGEQAIRSIIEARSLAKTKGLDVQMVGSSEAKKNLLFPSGHPRPKVVYMQHPASPLRYYPVASFHRHVFEHKFSEAVELLGFLGANEINVQHVKGWSRQFAGEMSASIPASAGGGQVGVSVGAQARTGENLMFTASLAGSDLPVLISNPVWYPHESTWQTLAKLRLECGLKEFSLTLNYEDDYQVNTNLTAAIEGAGFQIGGKFENHLSTVWTMSGQFGAAH